MFPMFQKLALDNLVDKCGRHYTICIHLKHQCFELLDSMHSLNDAILSTLAEFFIQNLKETSSHHYKSSKVKNRHFLIQYVMRDCGYYMLEYLAKWEGRKVPVMTDENVTELRKILTWNRVTNLEFNRRPRPRGFIEGAVKTANKKYLSLSWYFRSDARGWLRSWLGVYGRR
ncbi:hypothetical protein ZWY2020_057408 [Hordeum vulgare]|nr:hypothetical protein ZWY2020_057408 [Hordeum vulgare]